jgi:hypothetical protein
MKKQSRISLSVAKRFCSKQKDIEKAKQKREKAVKSCHHAETPHARKGVRRFCKY